MRQHFVIHRNQLQRFGGDRRCSRGHRSEGMALIQHLLTRHDVARHVPEINRHPFRAQIFEFVIRKVRSSDHRFDACQRLCLRSIDRFNACVGMRRTQNLAPQHTGQGKIGTVLRKPGDLGHTIRSHRTTAYNFECFFRISDRACHDLSPPHFDGGIQHRLDDFVISGAAAQVARQPVAHFFLGRIGITLQQRLCRDQHSRRADTAL